MSKYSPLRQHLAGLSTSRWEATFEEIEEILGFPLPESAHSYNPWWANQAGGGHSQSKAWQSVGWRTENVRPHEGQVTFIRSQPSASRYVFRPEEPDVEEESSKRPLTIAAAKAGLALQFEVPEDRIEITIKG